MPLVEIVIIKSGEVPEIEDCCVRSVKKNTDFTQTKLTVFDNSKLEANLGFLWNRFIRASKAEFILLLNSDTTVGPNSSWLQYMVAAICGHDADAAGPMTDKCGIAFQVGVADYRLGPKQVPTLSGFCLLLRKSSWEKYGGFREDFPFYGQESNLMDRLPKKLLVRSVFVHHEGGASFKASGRDYTEEKKSSLEVYKRNKAFDFKKKILFIGSTKNTGFPLAKGIEQGFKEFEREGLRYYYHVLGVPSWDELQAIKEFDPDLCLVVDTKYARMVQISPILGMLKCPKGLWCNDLREGYQCEEIKGWFDYIFLCWNGNREGPFSWAPWAGLVNKGVHYMPQGSVINSSLLNPPMIHDSLFIGSTARNQFHTGRLEYLMQLQSVVINYMERNKRLTVERQSPYLYRQYSHCISMSPRIPGYSSLRLYNIMAYGGLAVVHKFSGLEKLFTHGKHLYAFNTSEDARRIVRCQTDFDKVEKVRRAGWRLQQAKHTASFRLLNIFHTMLTGERGFWGHL